MTRRLVAAACVVAALVAPAYATQPIREEFGTILLNTPKDHAVDQRLMAERCIFQTIGNDPGVDYIGRVVSIRAEEADGRHRFRLLDGDMGPWDSDGGIVFGPDTDFDVAFYATPGPCDGTLPPAREEPVRFDGPFNEEGIIPAGSRFAVVTLANNPFSAFIFEVHGP